MRTQSPTRSSRVLRHTVVVHLMVLIAITAGRPAFAQSPPPAGGPWAGWARCQVDVQGPGYMDQQIHTWTVTGGTPAIEGAFRVYSGTWSVVGAGSLQRTQGKQTLVAEWATTVQGMSAPMAVFVRASDGRMFIQARHAQLRSPGAVAGYQQVTIDGKSQPPGRIAAEAFESSFPLVDGTSTSTRLGGSSSPRVNGSVGYMQPAGSRGTASCAWQFGQGAAAPGAPSTLAPRVIPTPTASGGAQTPDLLGPVFRKNR
jgi:hypothetical protein